jgi:NAD(P)-dependent dehydrogenase (short-subunit alcohol dehydrogenase family)
VTGIAGKVAVVTGGTRGVGAAIADALERAGAEVTRAGRSRCDVTRSEDVERLAAEVGAAQILVNAAGIFGPIGLLRDTDPRAWLETIAVDLHGPYLTCRAFVGGMIDAGWGRIVNVTSAATLHPPGPTNSAYGTAKAALNQLTRHLAAGLDGTGVTANVIHPGDVKTEMWADIRDQAARLGPEAELYTQWVRWVEETGGDPPEKAGELVLRICESDVNGEFLWIEDPLQAPIPSWEKPAFAQPWAE